MKSKLFSFILVLLFLFVLVGCGEPKVSDEEILNGYLSSVSLPTTIKEDFTLPYSVDNKDDHTITWVSSNTEVISISFNESESLYNATVTRQDEKTAVKITATFTLKNGISKDKEFPLFVAAKEKEQGGNGENTDPNKPLKEQFECITIAEAIAIANQCGETESTESYYVYGKIVNVSNPNYGEMTISDGTDSIYVYGVIDENGAFYNTIADRPVAGDEVVLYGTLKMFKGAPEMGRSVLKGFNHIKQEVDPSEYKAMSVQEARDAATGTKLQLEGVVAFVTYANGFVPNGFYLVDATGSIYVYGSNTAQQVNVGNTVKVAAEKTYYVNPDESYYASQYGYQGACQVQNPILLENNNQKNDFDKSWVSESTVKDIMETPLSNNITSNIFKVTALVNKVPGSGFINYYINDLDQKTGSYVYTACNGNDFEWLDEFDGKICTVYLSAINCKSTASGCIYRFIPVAVYAIDNYVFEPSDVCEFAVKYYALDQFSASYSGDPSLEVLTSVSNEFLKFENVNIAYTSSDTNVIYFDNNVMHAKDSGEVTVTITATYKTYTFTAEVKITVSAVEVEDYMNVQEAFDAEDGTEVTVKGVVVASLVNKTGFYLGDETGVIAISCSAETLKEVELGQLVIMKGERAHNKDAAATGYPGQSHIKNAVVVANYYGQHEYSKESFITDKTLADVYNLDYTQDFTNKVYVVTAKINIVETAYYTNIELVSEDGTVKLGLYCSSAKQYNWLKEFAGEVVTVEVAPVNWNDKKYYRGCVIAAYNSEKTLINDLNFQD